MLSVPQAMAGAFFALTFTGKSLSMPSMIGMIMLVGLVSKNAILLVDYTNTLRREHGMGGARQLLQAGPTRLQPILMTTLAMIGGMLPTRWRSRRDRRCGSHGHRRDRPRALTFLRC